MPLLADLLDEQNRLTAVDRFAARFEQGLVPPAARTYQDLIPLTAPAPGEQYAFAVDLDKCSGCKACVAACHALNGLDEAETWRRVGLLVNHDWRAPLQQTATTACHHCVEPGCLEGCPVLAYDKHPVTGIVRHLDDQCIGCQYCVMKCPYDVPQYLPERGIVRKCDMCQGRLAHGEAPACVQACPNGAIRIELVQKSDVTLRYRGPDAEARKLPPETPPAGDNNPFLPGSPDPAYTLPTTRFKSTNPRLTTLRPADAMAIKPADPHWPLVGFLVLSQLAVGCVWAALALPHIAVGLSMVGALTGVVALLTGTLHLGQPFKAWRAFLGWRTSWFSREVVVFGGFIACAIMFAASFWLEALAGWRIWFGLIAALNGGVGVFCSAMVYVDTHREFWNRPRSLLRFFGTTWLLGAMVALATGLVDHPTRAAWSATLLVISVMVSLAKLSWENRIFRHLEAEELPMPTPLNKTARLLAGELGLAWRARVACGVLGGVLLPAFAVLGLAAGAPTLPGWLAGGMVALCLAGEILERYLFFTAVAPAKMPGGIAA